MAVSQVVARPVRTTAQAGTALILVDFIHAWFLDMSEVQFGATVAMLTVVIGFIQTLVENKTGKGFLRTPSEPDQPVISPAKDVPVV